MYWKYNTYDNRMAISLSLYCWIGDLKDQKIEIKDATNHFKCHNLQFQQEDNYSTTLNEWLYFSIKEPWNQTISLINNVIFMLLQLKKWGFIDPNWISFQSWWIIDLITHYYKCFYDFRTGKRLTSFSVQVSISTM